MLEEHMAMATPEKIDVRNEFDNTKNATFEGQVSQETGEQILVSTDAIWFAIYEIKRKLNSAVGVLPAEVLSRIRPDVKTMVHQEIDPVKMEIIKSIENVSKFTEFVNLIPVKVYDGTMDLAKTVAGRLKKYADTLNGKTDDATKHFAQLKKPHYDYLERIRKNNKPAYEKLAEFSRRVKLIENEDAKLAMILKYFQTQ